MNDDIEKADKIVGINDYLRGVLGGSSTSKAMNTLRRGAYFEWLDEKHACGLGPGAPLADIAAEVVRIDAEERRKKEPDDGLPPGPWIASRGCPDPSGNNDRGDPYVSDKNMRLVCTGRDYTTCQYIARCGSPAVRRLLAAYDVTEERVNDNSRAIGRHSNGVVDTWFVPCTGLDILCWLTPRSKAYAATCEKGGAA